MNNLSAYCIQQKLVEWMECGVLEKGFTDVREIVSKPRSPVSRLDRSHSFTVNVEEVASRPWDSAMFISKRFNMHECEGWVMTYQGGRFLTMYPLVKAEDPTDVYYYRETDLWSDDEVVAGPYTDEILADAMEMRW